MTPAYEKALGEVPGPTIGANGKIIFRSSNEVTALKNLCFHTPRFV